MSSAFGGSRQLAKAPEKGVFPLDHDGVCKPAMKTFLSCLKEKEQDHYACRELSRAYLECRMRNKLMAEEDLDELGLVDNENAKKARDDKRDEEGKREASGFLAGGDQPARKKGWFT